MLKKLSSVLFLLVLLVSFITFASASDHISFRDYTVTYTDDIEVIVDCEGSSKTECNGGPLLNHELEVCGEVAATTGGNAFGPTNEYTFNFNVPKDASCTLGEYEFTFDPDEKGGELYETSGGSLKVNEKGSMNPNVGQYIYFALRDDTNPNRLNNMFISNEDPGYSDVNPNYAELTSDEPLIVYYDNALIGGQEAAARPQIGAKLEATTQSSLNDIAKIETPDEDYPTTCTYESGGINKAGCVIGNELMDESKNRLSESNYYSLSTISPIHYNGKYFPNGEVMVGYYPEYYKQGSSAANSEEGPYFFVCREGATMDNGNEDVPLVVDASESGESQDLYQCDTYWDQWKSVSECADGLDNDKDEKIDHPDANVASTSSDTSGCTSLTDDNEDTEPSCIPAVGYDGTNYIAYHGGFADSDGYCDGSNGNKETFSDWMSSLGASASSPPAPSVFECDDGAGNSYCDSRDYYFHDEDTSQAGDQIYYAKYYPTLEYLQDGIDVGTVPGIQLTSERTESYFVNSKGWTSARMALDGSSFSGDGVKPGNRQGAERIYGAVDAPTGRHEDSYWFDTKGMVDGDGNGYTFGSYADSWVVANAGAPGNNQVSVEFPGGYAGKCPTGTEWRKDTTTSNWECSGEPNWKQAVFLPEITDGSDTIGMVVMPYNFKDKDNEPVEIANLNLESWLTAYANIEGNTADSDQNLNKMKVSCYPGNSQPDYGSATEGTDYFNDTVSIPTDVQNPVGVSGTVDMSGHTTYTCEWSYIRQDTSLDEVDGIGCVIELQKTESACAGDSFTDIKEHFNGKQFDGTTLKLDEKHDSEKFTGLTG